MIESTSARRCNRRWPVWNRRDGTHRCVHRSNHSMGPGIRWAPLSSTATVVSRPKSEDGRSVSLPIRCQKNARIGETGCKSLMNLGSSATGSLVAASQIRTGGCAPSEFQRIGHPGMPRLVPQIKSVENAVMIESVSQSIMATIPLPSDYPAYSRYSTIVAPVPCVAGAEEQNQRDREPIVLGDVPSCASPACTPRHVSLIYSINTHLRICYSFAWRRAQRSTLTKGLRRERHPPRKQGRPTASLETFT